MSLVVAPDPHWADMAADEIAQWKRAVPGLAELHHIGSTSVPGLPAKPIIDLLAVFDSDVSRLGARGPVEGLGYEWMGEYGLSGRAYCRRDDPETGRRLVQSHGYTGGHTDIARHLAFRDALLANPALRAGYASVKGACAARHPEGGAAYGACNAGWIDKVEARAMGRTP